MSVFIIAEVGVNHNGDLSIARRLMDVSAQAGCDAVKFQTYKTELLVTRNASKAAYQSRNMSDGDDSQFKMLKNYEFGYDAFCELADYARELGIEFLSTPFDEESVDLLERVGVRRYKLSSGDLTNKPLITKIARLHKPMILSTGMATMEDIGQALTWCDECENSDVTLLHCTTNYPTAFEDVNMRAMDTIGREFGKPVGYSDHTIGIEIACMAVARGARVIEKHITLSNAMEGPDHKASLETKDLPKLVDSIRHIELAFGSSLKQPNSEELSVAQVARKSVVAAREIKAGEVLTRESLVIKRPGTGIEPRRIDELVGKRAARTIVRDKPLVWDDVDE